MVQAGRAVELGADWHRFLAAHGVDATALLAALPPEVAAAPGVRDAVTTYLDEGPVAVALVAPHLPTTARLLEIGSGIGLVSRFLAGLGHAVVAVEPASPGFDLMGQLATAVDLVCGPIRGHGSLRRLALGVDDLDPSQLGRFDLVFSSNVLEHVPDPGRAIIHLQDFVAPGGLQVHLCPNYALPYDPHIRRPLVPLIPRLTSPLLPRRLREDPVFLTVNFVTARAIRRSAAAAGLEVSFDRGLLAEALNRFDSDSTFAARHVGLGRMIRTLRMLGVDRLLHAVPPHLASPMRFSVRAPVR